MLCLVSGSPRRRALLDQLGVRYKVLGAEVDERVRPGESAADLVARLALAKAQAGYPQAQGLPLLGADTAVALDGEILGKPANRAQGLAMLARLSGREHEVFTGVALCDEGVERVIVNRSAVRFRVISAAERAAYWATGEPADKAGGYAIQGLGALFVAHLAGSYSGVMGLPLFETAALLRQAGVKLLPYGPT